MVNCRGGGKEPRSSGRVGVRKADDRDNSPPHTPEGKEPPNPPMANRNCKKPEKKTERKDGGNGGRGGPSPKAVKKVPKKAVVKAPKKAPAKGTKKKKGVESEPECEVGGGSSAGSEVAGPIGAFRREPTPQVAMAPEEARSPAKSTMYATGDDKLRLPRTKVSGPPLQPPGLTRLVFGIGNIVYLFYEGLVWPALISRIGTAELGGVGNYFVELFAARTSVPALWVLHDALFWNEADAREQFQCDAASLDQYSANKFKKKNGRFITECKKKEKTFAVIRNKEDESAMAVQTGINWTRQNPVPSVTPEEEESDEEEQVEGSEVVDGGEDSEGEGGEQVEAGEGAYDGGEGEAEEKLDPEARAQLEETLSLLMRWREGRTVTGVKRWLCDAVDDYRLKLRGGLVENDLKRPLFSASNCLASISAYIPGVLQTKTLKNAMLHHMARRSMEFETQEEYRRNNYMMSATTRLQGNYPCHICNNEKLKFTYKNRQGISHHCKLLHMPGITRYPCGAIIEEDEEPRVCEFIGVEPSETRTHRWKKHRIIDPKIRDVAGKKRKLVEVEEPEDKVEITATKKKKRKQRVVKEKKPYHPVRKIEEDLFQPFNNPDEYIGAVSEDQGGGVRRSGP